MNGDTAIRDFARRCVAELDKWTAAMRAEEEKLRASGCTIVEGGPIVGTVGPDGAEYHAWEITDWNTGAVLASGDGDPGEYEKASDALDARIGPLIHRDHVGEDVPLPEMPDPGRLPPTLAQAIFDWIEDSGTDADIAAFTGLPVDEVSEAR